MAEELFDKPRQGTKRGYLSTRKSHAPLPLRRLDWKRRWFVLKGGSFLSFKSWKDESKGSPESSLDLRLVTVKELKETPNGQPSDFDKLKGSTGTGTVTGTSSNSSCSSFTNNTNGTATSFCFEVISAVSPNKSFVLAAESLKERDEWMAALLTHIQTAFAAGNAAQMLGAGSGPPSRSSPATSLSTSPSSSPPVALKNQPAMALAQSIRHTHPQAQVHGQAFSTGESSLRKVQEQSSNGVCADCGQRDPEWVSLNLVVVICIHCSGVHRSLGAQFSRVRSLTLDLLSTDTLEALTCFGNGRANSLWEHNLLPNFKKPSSSHSRSEREIYIQAKYVKKQFLLRDEDNKELGQKLFASAAAGNLEETIWAVFQDGSVEYQSEPSPDISELVSPTADGRQLLLAGRQTPLHAACANKHSLVAQYLLNCGAKVDPVDEFLSTPLHYAALNHDLKLIVMLLKHGASVESRNRLDQTPLNMVTKLSSPFFSQAESILLEHKMQRLDRIFEES
eukprot:TRINITY_DN2223_c0_g1_i1.p1 TRINITY_DN2223_c0_g1~~TRINITY_DN2223_c0_g1_i1.p1  ORF type:complete len:507 (+),score=102.56 TRINITY_DN2223_c0_g1_i1:581-2101(+)